ncbi:MAG TPA: phosphatidate cytidylyltransferase [Bacteroidales bacterium]|nr:MAG: hypothetical protein A2W98_14415 [Bacteroidetes bacterium GWF2_33_38]OFY76105.1 MAG: hypothetical protein A2265_06885 [Bacteroidetes bacterium RIFOXYA12_FULL_33_9]HBF88509.1 phosphatidate cytidylyltransferase [Bacteroidales bacterium]
MKNITTRLLTGLLFVVVFLGCIFFNRYSFVVLFLFLISTGMMEFYRTAMIDRVRSQLFYGVFIGLSLFAVNFLYASNKVEESIFLILIPLFSFVFIFELYLKNKRPFTNIAYTLLGVIYIALPFSLFNYFVFEEKNAETIYSFDKILLFFLFQWSYDTFAYLFGITLGRNRIFESVSPKKSWEGAIGGMISTIAVAYFISPFFPILSRFDWMVIAGIIVVFGTYGDLVESLYKRSINIKDSGNILPGHGGILDRFDSTIMASPFVFLYLQII